MKSEGSVEPPQDIMEEYNECSVPQYTRYPRKHYILDLIYREYISISECPRKNNEQDEVLSLGVFDRYDFYGRLP